MIGCFLVSLVCLFVCCCFCLFISAFIMVRVQVEDTSRGTTTVVLANNDEAAWTGEVTVSSDPLAATMSSKATSLSVSLTSCVELWTDASVPLLNATSFRWTVPGFDVAIVECTRKL